MGRKTEKKTKSQRGGKALPTIECTLPPITPAAEKKIESMISDYQTGQNLELEASFSSIDAAAFERIARGYASLVGREKITARTMLDISINMEGMRSYRISISGGEASEEFLVAHNSISNSSLKTILLEMEPKEGVEIYRKSRVPDGVQDLTDLGVRFKMATEVPYDGTKPNLRGSEPLTFRLKSRYSIEVTPSIRLDLTKVQSGKTIVELSHSTTCYEAELELTGKLQPQEMWNEVCRVLQYIQDSDAVITRSAARSVVSKMEILLGKRPGFRQPISINPTAAVQSIPSRYGVTDKADGERHQLYLTDSGSYLINTNRVVRELNVQVNGDWGETVLDGEVIKVEKKDGSIRRVFLAFDIIYSGGVDYRVDNRYTLSDRLSVLDRIIDEGFANLIPYPSYTEDHSTMELEAIEEYHSREMPKYTKRFRKMVESGTDILLTRKLYFLPYGISPSEIYSYCKMIWKVYRGRGGMPYELDGLILTPLSSPYSTQRGSDRNLVSPEYKWKPSHLNTIDFYITFKKDEKGGDQIFYEESAMEGNGRPYKLAELQVGRVRGQTETPVAFVANGQPQVSRLFISEDDLIRTEEGDIVEDRTVVEYYYLQESDLPPMDRWVALRVRHDKTQMVQRLGKKYGNNNNVAESIWRTISHPVTFDAIVSLSGEETYAKQAEILLQSAQRTSRTDGHINRRDGGQTYYQIKTKMGSGVRAFNNRIKEDQIQNYARGKSVLDLGCGRGGDLDKFYNAEVKEYVGVDIESAGLFLIQDSALSRAKKLQRRGASFPIRLVHADAKVPFTGEDQKKALPHMRDSNVETIEKYLSRQYEVVSSQFSLHYYMSDSDSWDTFCRNLKSVIAPGGYFLASLFDGNLVHQTLKENNPAIVDYVDQGGVKHKYFEIRKMYPDNPQPGPGLAIEFYNSLISEEDVFNREYLVFPQYLIESMWEKCGLRLVETNSFYNMFHLYRDYYTGGKMQNRKGRDGRIAAFYESLHKDSPDYSAALAGYKMGMLNRYYIFQNTDSPCAAPVLSRLQPVLKGGGLEDYFRIYNLYADTDVPHRSTQDHYAMMRRTTGHRPSVYLLTHKKDGALDLRLLKSSEGIYSIMMYKNPKREYYPIYHSDGEKRQYLLTSKKVISSLGRRLTLENHLARE